MRIHRERETERERGIEVGSLPLASLRVAHRGRGVVHIYMYIYMYIEEGSPPNSSTRVAHGGHSVIHIAI